MNGWTLADISACLTTVHHSCFPMHTHFFFLIIDRAIEKPSCWITFDRVSSDELSLRDAHAHTHTLAHDVTQPLNSSAAGLPWHTAYRAQSGLVKEVESVCVSDGSETRQSHSCIVLQSSGVQKNTICKAISVKTLALTSTPPFFQTVSFPKLSPSPIRVQCVIFSWIVRMLYWVKASYTAHKYMNKSA